MRTVARIILDHSVIPPFIPLHHSSPTKTPASPTHAPPLSFTLSHAHHTHAPHPSQAASPVSSPAARDLLISLDDHEADDTAATVPPALQQQLLHEESDVFGDAQEAHGNQDIFDFLAGSRGAGVTEMTGGAGVMMQEMTTAGTTGGGGGAGRGAHDDTTGVEHSLI